MWRSWVDGASMGVKEAEMEKVWGTKRERKKQKDF